MIFSYYQENIDVRFLDIQRNAIKKFLGEDIYQTKDFYNHGYFLEHIIYNTKEDLVVFDIDCIPLSKSLKYNIQDALDNDYPTGIPQVAWHVSDEIYLAPAFFVMSRRFIDFFFKEVNVFANHTIHDVFQNFTQKFSYKHMIKYMYPSKVEKPKWKLEGDVEYGIGTYYENKVYHLYESRFPENQLHYIKKFKHLL